MRRILKDPLLHFLLLGAAIFVAYGLTRKSGEDRAPGEIVVTRGQEERLAAGFASAWRRPPTPEELDGLVRDWVREEVYNREAIALGMDKDDTIIRRRLRQKMEFVSEDVAAQTEPTDADLEAYLAAHPDAFRVERRFTFKQVYLDPAKHRENLARDAAELLGRLRSADDAADASTLGDPFLLDRDFAAAPEGEIARQFGAKFAAALGELATGQWLGPVESGYGAHLVLVAERTEGRLPALAEARDAVRREWANARRLEANEKFYQGLLSRYTVSFEGRESPTTGKKVAVNAAK